MATLVTQLTIEEAHKEFSSLPDKIAAKYVQLDSGEFRAVGIPAFNAKSKLAVLFAHMSQLCQTEHANANSILEDCHSSRIEEHFLGQNYRQAVLVRVLRIQLCSHRYVRITGLLSARLVGLTGEQLNPQDGRLFK